ncbi:hypothetical protein [Enterocloster hominis (ex Hitch et al. 2024)]|uniref:hypothetical protein n=1 Tax=Enterocloster hominis (ex Hitch et al. 2024) TaxID=1917870 RepID=UPI002F3E797A
MGILIRYGIRSIRQDLRRTAVIELKGRYNEAKIFTDVVDDTSVEQVMLLLNQEFAAGSRIRLMPDIHAGAGCTIGTTMTIKDKAVPNLVGLTLAAAWKWYGWRSGVLTFRSWTGLSMTGSRPVLT